MKVRTVFPDGQSYGKLKVLSEGRMRAGQRMWNCVCVCGNKTTAYVCHLRSGKTKSCGCGQGLRIHGQWRTRTYGIWASMKSRCLNPDNDAYHYYGQRGITVCERWRDFANFLEDMGHAPTGLKIERVDNDGNYEPGNCVWATHTIQMRNTRRTRRITVRGVTGCLDELAHHFGVKEAKRAWARLRLGWTPEEALFTPLKQKRICFTVRGINGCVAELCRHFGLQHGTALKRLQAGWTPDDAFCTPVQA